VSNAPRPGTAVALQQALPAARVVKTLNTMLFLVMAQPAVLSVPATVFLSGDDAPAKADVQTLLISLGWSTEQFLDLGGIDTADSVEAAFPLAMAAVRAHGIAPFALSAAF
jgi:predicted dinucleotide-binding enzyme